MDNTEWFLFVITFVVVVGLMAWLTAYLIYRFHYDYTRREALIESTRISGFSMICIVVVFLLLHLGVDVV